MGRFRRVALLLSVAAVVYSVVSSATRSYFSANSDSIRALAGDRKRASFSPLSRSQVVLQPTDISASAPLSGSSGSAPLFDSWGSAPLFDSSGSAPLFDSSNVEEQRSEVQRQKGWWASTIIGTGSAVPDTVITNFDLEQIVNTSDAWIVQRTGISQRRVLLPFQSLQRLAADASLRALESARVKPQDLDAVIVASSTPDDLFGDATSIAGLIGATKAVGWDLRAACSGFLFALVNAAQFLESKTYRTILVVGSDALSRYVDWEDRNTCVLFGDGAGAVIMQSVSSPSSSGLLAFSMSSDPQGHDHLHVPLVCPPTKSNFSHKTPLTTDAVTLQKANFDFVKMNGGEIYRFVSNTIPRAIENLLSQAGISIEEVDWLLLHQANSRILSAVATRLGLPMSKVLNNVKEYGNTSAASIPLALDEAVRKGMVKQGHVIVSAAFGAGLSWGVTVLRWTEATQTGRW